MTGKKSASVCRQALNHNSLSLCVLTLYLHIPLLYFCWISRLYTQTGGDINIMLLLESSCVWRDLMPLQACVKLIWRLLLLNKTTVKQYVGCSGNRKTQGLPALIGRWGYGITGRSDSVSLIWLISEGSFNFELYLERCIPPWSAYSILGN